MNLLPFDHFTMKTGLSPKQIKAVLDENIVSYSFDFDSSCQGFFGGYTLGENSFYLELIGFRNVAQLEIKASVTENENGSIVQGKIKLSIMALLIKTIVLCFLVFLAIIMTCNMISNHQIEKQGVVVYVLTIAISAFWLWDFNNDASAAKEKLQTLLTAAL